MSEYKIPSGYTFFSSIPRMLKQVKDPIGTMEESMRIYDGTYSVFLGSRKYIVTQDPVFIEHVLRGNHRNYHKSPLQSQQLGRFLGKGLLTSNGDFWLRQRRLIQPGFHAEKIKALYTIIANTADKFLSTLKTGQQDVYPLMNFLALDLVINTLFDIKIPTEVRNRLSRFVNETQAFVIKDIRQPYKSWWFKVSGEYRHNENLSREAREIVRGLIQQRKNSGERRDDLLDMLLDARYEDNGEPMEEEQMIDEILVLIIAGHETTANALSWALYLLAEHPQEQDHVRSISKDLSKEEAVLNEALNNVIKESMRLYPPAWISDRLALADDEVNEFKFPKDTIVIMFYYGLHRNPEFWKNPESFIPSRFSKDNFDKRASKAFYPFGGGPRLCIGNNFAMAEMTIFLQHFLRQYSVASTGVKPKINALVTLKPDQVVLNVNRL